MKLLDRAWDRAEEAFDEHHLTEEEFRKVYRLTKGGDPRELNIGRLGEQLFYLKMRHRRTYALLMKVCALFSVADYEDDEDGAARGSQ